MTIPRPVIVMPFFIAHILIKYLRWSDLVLNVFWLTKASRAALGAVSLAVRLPDVGPTNPFWNLNFPTGMSVRRYGTMRFSLSTSGVL